MAAATPPKPAAAAVATAKPGAAAGLVRRVSATGGAYQREPLRWTSAAGQVVPVEVVIDAVWDSIDSAPSSWTPKSLTYEISYQAGVAYDRLGAGQWSHPDDPRDGALFIPEGSVPANGLRFRLTAHTVDVTLRVGAPANPLTGHRMRVSICPVDSLALPLPIPPVDALPAAPVDSAELASVDGNSYIKRLPIGAREFRCSVTDTDHLDDYLASLHQPDGTTLQLYTVADALEWTTIPFEAAWFGANYVESLALTNTTVQFEFR